MKKIKILYFITGLKKGGAENQIYNLMTVLSKDPNFEIKIITLFDGEHRKNIENLGIEVKVFDKKVNVLNIVSIFKFFIRNVEEFKPDIVHSFLFHTNIISKLSLFFIKKNFKLICSYRSVIKKLFWIKNLEYINMSKADLLLSNSKVADNDLDIYNNTKLKRKVIYNSFNEKNVDITKVKELKKQFKGKKIILTVANFRKEKDFTTNVLTCCELSKKRADFVFVYVGNPGPELKIVDFLVKKYHLENFIVNLGQRNDILELLKMSDCFFMPTLFESQSNSLMEAMYMKIPIVTTDVPGNVELVKKGYLCNPKDYITMSSKIELILDKKYNKTWVKINYNRIKSKFSIENISKEYAKIYKKLLF